MGQFSRSDAILERNRKYIPGGMSSLNRLTDPNISFVRGEGSRIHDAEGNEYIDYHGAFAPQMLGYGHAVVREAVEQVLRDGNDLFGAGPTELEGRLAELIVDHVGWVEQVAFCNTGSEASAQAIRLARAATGRDHVIVMQGGYNGWHNDVACNLMTPLDRLGSRVSPGEYPFHPISAGIPEAHRSLVHPINFNDPDSVAWVCERYPVAALITEPILQNVGLIKPVAKYLDELRSLADRYGFLLIFDEVKTGFRHGFGGCAGLFGVAPDLAVYGKAIASGYPLGVVAGKERWLRFFNHPDADRRVLLAGTYNAHPVPVAAAIATLEYLLSDAGVYSRMDSLGARMESGLMQILENHPRGIVIRQGSAFVVYFMDHSPRDWHDLTSHHNYGLDQKLRNELLRRGIFFFPLPTKQCSISAAHTERDIDLTLEAFRDALAGCRP